MARWLPMVSKIFPETARASRGTFKTQTGKTKNFVPSNVSVGKRIY
jgi:hypothetical protein